ncbi:hypothetical protein DITRI_Ditri12bG0159900 [Diplodiscus trichospermus]
MSHITTLPRFGLVCSAHKPGQKGHKKTKPSKSTMGFSGVRKELWRCVENCGACCKLAKGPAFATPEEIFTDPSDVELYRSLIGPDGWCVHYEKSTRTCSIYSDRPYFCRVEPDIFKKLYGIQNKMFNKEACRSCHALLLLHCFTVLGIFTLWKQWFGYHFSLYRVWVMLVLLAVVVGIPSKQFMDHIRRS